MIEFFVIAIVVYMAAGDNERRSASGQAIRTARSAGGAAARNTWTQRRPDRSASKQRINKWWNKTPARRTVRTGGRVVRTTGQFCQAGLLAGLSAFWAGSRTAAGQWRTTRREQREQGKPETSQTAPGIDPEQFRPVPGQTPGQPAGQPEGSVPDNPWGDPQPIRLVVEQGGGQVERFRLDILLAGSDSPDDSGGFASRLPKAEAIARAEQWAKSTIMTQLRKDDVGVLYRITGGAGEQVGSYRGVKPMPAVTDETTTTPSTTEPAKEAAMSTGPGELSDLTTTIAELETVDTELLESELWPILEAWSSGSDLFSRHLGDDTHLATDEVAEAIQGMLDRREVVLDAVEAAIQEAKTTIGDAA